MCIRARAYMCHTLIPQPTWRSPFELQTFVYGPNLKARTRAKKRGMSVGWCVLGREGAGPKEMWKGGGGRSVDSNTPPRIQDSSGEITVGVGGLVTHTLCLPSRYSTVLRAPTHDTRYDIVGARARGVGGKALQGAKGRGEESCEV